MSFIHKKHPSSKLSLYRSLAITFFSIAIFIIASIFYISFSWATITIIPDVTQTDYTFIVPLSDQLKNEKKEDALQGTSLLIEADQGGKFTVKPTQFTPQKMSGTMTIVNKSTKDQSLRETTRLTQGSDVLFRTKKFVVVPAGGSIDVEVEADKVGELKIDTGAHFVLPGLWPGLQLSIYGASLSPQKDDTGGTGILSDSDMTQARESLQKKLEEDLTKKASLEKELRGSTLNSVAQAHFTNEKTDHVVGDSVQNFSMQLHGTSRIFFFDPTHMKSFLLNKVKQKTPLGYEILPIHDTDIEYASNTESTGNENSIKAIIHLKRRLGSDALSINKKNLAGLGAQEIIDRLKKYPDISDVTVRFYPFWVIKAPLLVDHIHMLVKTAE